MSACSDDKIGPINILDVLCRVVLQCEEPPPPLSLSLSPSSWTLRPVGRWCVFNMTGFIISIDLLLRARWVACSSVSVAFMKIMMPICGSGREHNALEPTVGDCGSCSRSIRHGGCGGSRDGWGVRSHIPRPGLDSHKINNSCEDAGRWYENKLVGMCFSSHCCDELCVEWSISLPCDLPASTCIAISARFLSLFDSLVLTTLLLLFQILPNNSSRFTRQYRINLGQNQPIYWLHHPGNACILQLLPSNTRKRIDRC